MDVAEEVGTNAMAPIFEEDEEEYNDPDGPLLSPSQNIKANKCRISGRSLVEAHLVPLPASTDSLSSYSVVKSARKRKELEDDFAVAKGASSSSSNKKARRVAASAPL